MLWRRGVRPGRLRFIWLRLRRKLPRQLVRNLGLFYLILVLITAALVFGQIRSGVYHMAWRQGSRLVKGAVRGAKQALPVVLDVLPISDDLSRSILSEGLPDSPQALTVTGQLSPQTVRSLVHVVTDYDLAQPRSLIAAAFPGSRQAVSGRSWVWAVDERLSDGPYARQAQAGTAESVIARPGEGKAELHRQEHVSNRGSDSDVEVVITAPEYQALAGVDSSSDLAEVESFEDEAKPVLSEALPEPPVEKESVSIAESRVQRIARVNWGSAPLVAIYHTHTGETYRTAGVDSSKSYAWDNYPPGSGPMPGVVQVGERVAQELQRRYGIPVVHSTKVHDYPVFAYAYSNSEKTAKMLVERYPSLAMIFDIHRDKGATVEVMGGEHLARVLIVVATATQSRLSNPHWRENLEFAQLLKRNFDRLYPGLCRGLLVRSTRRYNQNVHPRSLLLEIGASSDNLEHALASAELVADVIAETLWQIRMGKEIRPRHDDALEIKVYDNFSGK